MRPSPGGIVAGVVLVAALGACGLFGARDWASPVGRSHPLAGAIWDVSAGRRIDEDALFEQLVRRRFVLLGEKHDNADHHRLQARALRALVAAGRRPAVGFEMFPLDVAPKLAAAQSSSRLTPDDVREAVAWDASRWPDWSLYLPLVEAALEAKLWLVAANAPSSLERAVVRGGLGVLAASEADRLGLGAPLHAVARQELIEELRRAHCGYAAEEQLDEMADVQRARDAHMALALFSAPRRFLDGAVLVAGAEHVRRDRGVPLYLRERTRPGEIAVLAFLEVDLESEEVATDLAVRFGGAAPFDWVWYTPRVEAGDPCERFRGRLERMRRP